jgi:hypothetical protein
MLFSMLFSLALLASTTHAQPQGAAVRALRGQIIVAEQAFPEFQSDGQMLQYLRKTNRTTLKKGDESWQLHFMAFFKKAPEVDKVNIVFYDVTKASAREYVNYFELEVKPQAAAVVSNLRLSDAHGFVAGHRYQMLITRLVDGKEDIYARTALTLR